MTDRKPPREIVLGSCATYGEDAVIDFAIAVLTGEVTPEEAFTTEVEKLKWLVGPTVGGWAKLDPVNFYWARVWAARIFLYVWRDDAVEALLVQRRLDGAERLVPADLPPQVAFPDQRLAQPVGVLVEPAEAGPLRADEALAERIVLVAADAGHVSALVKGQRQAADGFAERACPVDGRGHHDS
jgi:hypothetical protein